VQVEYPSLGDLALMKPFLLLLAFALVAAIAALGGYLFEMRQSTEAYELVGASETFELLGNLRAGDTNAAMDALETDLDMRVIVLRGILDESPRMKHAPNYTNLLRRVAAYRAAHPHHNGDTNIDSLVVQALNSVAQPNR
jgi:hypothetical protein